MTDSDAQLGPAITSAVRFLRKIHRDIGELIAALDGVMAERSWRPTEKSRVSWALSNGSEPTKWVLDHLFRYYFKAGTLNDLEELVAFVIQLDPPAAFDEPVMLGVVARFAAPTSYKTVMDQWKESSQVIEALPSLDAPRQLLPEEVSRFLPAASHVFGTVAPLCSLGGTESLMKHFIDPLLKNQPTLGR